MATADSTGDVMSEYCETCQEETPHAVSVEIITENAEADHASFSREPYRVATCRICGQTKQTRMNNV